MRFSHVRRGVLASVALLLVLPAGLAAAGTAHPSPADPTGKPKSGVCYDLTVKQIGHKTSTAKSVSCSKTHTTITSAVVQLPQGLSWSSSEDDLAAAAAKKCYPSFFKQVGGNYKLNSQSTFSFGYFRPTKAEINAGARWIRCDVDLIEGPTSVQKLPSGTRPFLSHGLPTSERRCGTAKLTYLSCNHKHTYRSVGAFSVSQKKYPTQAQFEKFVQKGCPRFDHRRTGYGTIQGTIAWALGDRTITCFAKTTN